MTLLAYSVFRRALAWFRPGWVGAGLVLVLGSAGCGMLGAWSSADAEPSSAAVLPARDLSIAAGVPKNEERTATAGAGEPGGLMDAPPGPPTTPVIPSPPQFTPIGLPGALALAGAENPTIAIAQAAVRVALAEQWEACALLLPNLNAGMNFDHHSGNLQTSFGALREVDRQDLYVGAGAGAFGAGTVAIPGVQLFSPLADALFAPKIASQVVAARSFEAAAANNTVLLDVGVRYYDLVGAEGRLAAVRQSELNIGEVVRLTAEQAKAGQGNQADADRAKSEALLFHQDEQRAEEEVAVASARLAELLNLDPSMRLLSQEGPVQFLELVDAKQPLESLIQTALEYRPEVGARNAAIGANQTRYRQECYRPFLPTLSVGYSAGGFGGSGSAATATTASFNSRTDLDAFAFWTLQNLGFGNLALKRRRRAEVNEAEAELFLTINQIREEVAEAFADSASHRQEVEIARRQMKRAHDGFQSDVKRVRGLVGRPIEVLNSARLLASARQEFVRALTRYNQAQLRLFVSLGQPPTVAPAVMDKQSPPPSPDAPR